VVGAVAALALVAGLSAAGPAIPRAFATLTGLRCRSVSGSASVSPGLRTAAGPQTATLDSFNISRCGVAHDPTTADITGTLKSTSASCSLASSDRFHGLLTINWSDGEVSYIKTARVDSTNSPDDAFEVRLRGTLTGGTRTGSTLRVVLHLAPTAGDCGSGITGLAMTNVSELTIGGPYPTCQTVAGAATISPGLSTTAAAQSMHLDSFQISGCRAAGTAKTANVIGALQSDSASCPLGRADRFHGSLEIDWDNHFVSIVPNAGIASTNNAADPFEVRLQGLVKHGADTGATFLVILHLGPTQGDCSTGVTNVAITNVGPLTIS
jgi:hypothetical protein